MDFRQQMAHGSSLCRKDLTPRHFVVSSTSVKRAGVINWKRECAVLCFSFDMQNLYRTKRIRGRHYFLFSLEKTTAESYRSLPEAYCQHAPSQDTRERWFRRSKSGDFEVAEKVHGKLLKKFEGVECKHCWTKNISNHKSNSLSNWALNNF